jgi:uncharacterized protein (TIGR02996 family)
MHNDPLLSAILDDPDDTARRMVYADWLEESGDAARAEFIRVQCRLADLDEADPARDDLEQRERELLAAHEKQWLGGQWPTGVSDWEFRRGFVEAVTFRVAADSGSFVHTPPLTDQPVWHVASQPAHTAAPESHDPRPRRWAESCVYMRFFPGCRSLDLSGNMLVDEHIRLVLQMTNSVGLQRLNLAVNQLSPTSGGMLGHDSGLNGLVGLNLANGSDPPDLTCNQLGDAGVRGLTDRPVFARLSDLLLDGNALSRESVGHLATTPFAPHLTALSLNDNPLGLSGLTRLAEARTFRSLSGLAIERTGSDLAAIEEVLNNPHFAGLRELSLGEDDLGDELFDALLESRAWPTLESLRVIDSYVGPDSLHAIAHAATGPRRLDLSRNPVESAGVQHLARAGWLDRLNRLTLVEAALDDDALFALARSPDCGNLRALHLGGNDGIHDAGVLALAASPFLRRLTVLDLRYLGVGDEALSALMSSGTLGRLTGLGLRGGEVTPAGVWELARSPALERLTWLDLSEMPDLDESVLEPLAESQYLSPLLKLDVHGVTLDEPVRRRLRERLGRRFGE